MKMMYRPALLLSGGGTGPVLRSHSLPSIPTHGTGGFGDRFVVWIFHSSQIMLRSGYAMIALSALTAIYYNIIIAWSFYYVAASLQVSMLNACSSAELRIQRPELVWWPDLETLQQFLGDGKLLRVRSCHWLWKKKPNIFQRSSSRPNIETVQHQNKSLCLKDVL